MSLTKANQLQLLQQNIQNLNLQKQQLDFQMVELNSALTELKTTEKSYKIIGKIMLSISPDKLCQELEEQKEVLQIKLQHFVRQEEKLKKELESLQSEVMEELNAKIKK